MNSRPKCKNDKFYNDMDLRTEQQWQKSKMQIKDAEKDKYIKLWSNQYCNKMFKYYSADQVEPMTEDHLKQLNQEKKAKQKKQKENSIIENILIDIQRCIWSVGLEYHTTWQWLEQGRLPKDNAKWILGHSYGDTVTPDMLNDIYKGDIPLDKLQEYTEQHKDIYHVLWREKIVGSEKYYYCSIDDTYEATAEELAIAEQSYEKREYGYYDGMPWWTSRKQLLKNE